MTNIFVNRDHTNGFTIKVKGDDTAMFKEAIETLKSYIPAYFRSYDPTLKEWTVSAAAHDRFDRWLTHCRATLQAEIQWLDADSSQPEEEQRWTPPPRRQPKLNEAYATLFLLPQAPPEVIKASYRALAQKHHPDHQGDGATMQKINAAYRILSKQMAA